MVGRVAQVSLDMRQVMGISVFMRARGPGGRRVAMRVGAFVGRRGSTAHRAERFKGTPATVTNSLCLHHRSSAAFRKVTNTKLTAVSTCPTP